MKKNLSANVACRLGVWDERGREDGTDAGLVSEYTGGETTGILPLLLLLLPPSSALFLTSPFLNPFLPLSVSSAASEEATGGLEDRGLAALPCEESPDVLSALGCRLFLS